jgi:hypothetical protein
MPTFDELVSSRKQWIEEVLKPWCAGALRKDLRLAELEWVDIAGKIAPEMSLWTWAWGRFPDLVHEELPGVDETAPVTVRLKDGREFTGYPDGRQSERGQLVLVAVDDDPGPISIDEIASVTKAPPLP